MLGEAIWSLKCDNWSAEVAEKGNFRGFFNISQKGLVGSCSYLLQMFSRPIPIIWCAQIGCIISLRVTLKNRTVCDCLRSFLRLIDCYALLPPRRRAALREVMSLFLRGDTFLSGYFRLAQCTMPISGDLCTVRTAYNALGWRVAIL